MQINKRNSRVLLSALFWVFMLELPLILGNPGSILFDAFVIGSYFLGGSSRYGLKKSGMMILTVILAAIIGSLRGFDIYNVFKDIFYLITPVIVLMTGEIWARKRKPEEMTDFIVAIGVLLSIIYSALLLSTYGLELLENPRLYRDESDNNYLNVNIISVISLSLALKGLLFNKDKRKLMVCLILLFAIYLSGSRSLYLAVLIYALTITYPLYKKNLPRFLAIASLAVIAVAIYAATSSGSLIAERFMRSTEEMRIQDYYSMQDVNENYRGFEAYRALLQYDSLPLINKVFGGGCGQFVDLGELSPFVFTEIPILHNGYPYFLIKIGIFGLLIYMAFFLKLTVHYLRRLRRASGMSGKTLMFYLIGIASVFSLLLLQFSVNAVFNFGYVAPISFISIVLYYEKTRQI